MSNAILLTLLLITRSALVYSFVPHHTELFAGWKKDFDAKWHANGLPAEGLAIEKEWQSPQHARKAWGLASNEKKESASGSGSGSGSGGRLLRSGNDVSLLSTRESSTARSKWGFINNIAQAFDYNSKCNRAMRYKGVIADVIEFIEDELKETGPVNPATNKKNEQT